MTSLAANIVQQLEPLLPDGAARQSMMKELKPDSRAAEYPPVPGGKTESAIDRVAAITWSSWEFPRRLPHPCNPENRAVMLDQESAADRPQRNDDR